MALRNVQEYDYDDEETIPGLIALQTIPGQQAVELNLIVYIFHHISMSFDFKIIGMRASKNIIVEGSVSAVSKPIFASRIVFFNHC